MYEFKEEYKTGIEQIDREHCRLFEIAEETWQLKNNEFMADKYDELRRLIGELRDYTIMHFEHEEAYMKSIEYKKLFTQKVQHDEFRKWLNEIDLDGVNAEFEDQDGVADSILKYLTDWLVSHILNTDKQIGE